MRGHFSNWPGASFAVQRIFQALPRVHGLYELFFVLPLRAFSRLLTFPQNPTI